MEDETYYSKHRQEILQKVKEQRTERSQEQIEKEREYQRLYYQAHKEEKKAQARASYKPKARPPRKAPAEPKPPKKPRAKPLVNKAKLPKPYFQYDTDETPAGLSHYQKKKLTTICPLGYFEAPATDNPFKMVFN